MDNTDANKREYGIDLLRIILMIFVPLVHVTGIGGVINLFLSL